MASESVASTTLNEVFSQLMGSEEKPLRAFQGFDSSVFREWAMAVSDVIACGTKDAATESVPITFGLIYQLIKAADELDERERALRRQEATA